MLSAKQTQLGEAYDKTTKIQKSPNCRYVMKCNGYLLLSSDAALAILFVILVIVLKYIYIFKLF